MKRFFFFICVLVVLCDSSSFAAVEWDGTSAPWTKGTGTKTNPYLIETPQQLFYLSEMVGAGTNTYKDKYFKQTQDFDMKSLAFSPIGHTPTTPFEGNYNGNNRFIANLNFSSVEKSYIALFGFAVGSTFNGIIIKDSFQCSPSGTLTASIVGFGRGVKLTNCRNEANIDVTGGTVAGIAAYLDRTCVLTKCSNSGKISSVATNSEQASSSAAGIVGEISVGDCTLVECFNIGAISSISNSTSTSNYDGAYATSAGIIANYAPYSSCNTTLERCFNTGVIYATSSGTGTHAISHAGGICTITHGKCIIDNCYAHCIVTAYSSAPHTSSVNNVAYGFASKATVSNSYFAGTLNGTKKYSIIIEGSAVNCYFNSDCGVSKSDYGIVKTAEQLKSVSMPTLLNDSETETIWTMDNNNTNDGYPIFGWQNVAIYEIVGICDETQGIISGSGKYAESAIATLTIIPNECYLFKQWSDGNTDNPRSVVVTGDATYTAVFERKQYTVTATADNAEQGSVSITAE